jgi:CRISPR-associated endonuclease Cas1
MPHIRPNCPEQSATNSPRQHHLKPNSLAARLTRDVLLLRSAGSSRRAISAALNLSHRRVQTILNGAAPGVQSECKAFTARERDADYASVEAALRAGSTLRAEYLRYLTRCPAPYSYTSFWRRFEEWLASQPDPGIVPGSPPAERAARKRAIRSDGKVAAKLRLQSEVRVSPANTCDDNHGGINGSQRKESCETATGGSPLEGGLLFISEPDTALQIRKGALCVRYRDGVERTFPRARHRVRSIILASPGVNVTIEAMRFAIDEEITIFVMHRAGEALALLTDAPTLDASAHALELRRAQLAAPPKQRLEVARAILAMKVEACELLAGETQDALQSVTKARDGNELLIAEAQTAKIYWRRYIGFRPRLTDRCPAAWSIFRGRLEKRGKQLVPRWARTPSNAALNYAYAVALGNCTRALVGLDLDPSFGFLHHGDAPGRLSLSYDVIELLRPRVDACVFRFLKSRSFDRKEFLETGSQVLLAPKTAREVALRVLEEVPAGEAERAARLVANVILSKTPNRRGPLVSNPPR